MVIQGAPGTGKTAVGLHRAAWLLYHYLEQLQTRGILVVGPNRVFMKYVANVLPSLGETTVDQRAVHRLMSVDPVAVDDALVRQVKARPEMADVISRALVERIRRPTGDIEVDVAGAKFALNGERVASMMPDFDPRERSYIAARNEFRNVFERYFREEHDRAAEARTSYIPSGAGEAPPVSAEFQRTLDRMWPSFGAADFVRQLLGSTERLARACDGYLSEIEQRLLYRQAAARLEDVSWSISDIPLIDEAESLLNGPPAQYGHIVVDEAQDLTPMELRMIGRRSRAGSFTLLGDIAQATGVQLYSRWSDVLEHLDLSDVSIEELVDGYRVPAEIMKVAALLLPLIAPDAALPVAHRHAGAGALVFRSSDSDDVATAAVTAVGDLADQAGTKAVIAPESMLIAIRAELERAGIEFSEAARGNIGEGVELISPRLAKGLEFDHVVLVEPSRVIREGLDGQGHRELYVALTRATRSLICLHDERLPWPLEDSEGSSDHGPVERCRTARRRPFGENDGGYAGRDLFHCRGPRTGGVSRHRPEHSPRPSAARSRIRCSGRGGRRSHLELARRHRAAPQLSCLRKRGACRATKTEVQMPDGGDLFIVDNSDSGLDRRSATSRSGAEIAKAFDIATGYFEIGALLALDGKWQKLDKIRILMGAEVTHRTTQGASCDGGASDAPRPSRREPRGTRRKHNPFLNGVPAHRRGAASRPDRVPRLRQGQVPRQGLHHARQARGRRRRRHWSAPATSRARA